MPGFCMFCLLRLRLPPELTRTDALFPYSKLFRSAAHVAERALEQARRADRRHHRRVAAETAAVDADAILVRVALVDRPFRGVDDVVLDAFGPLLVAGIPEGLAVAARAAVIHLEHELAAAGKQMRFDVEAPTIARAGQAAVRETGRAWGRARGGQDE